MHKWMASAGGGTSQRLKRGPATVRSRESDPPDEGSMRISLWVVMFPPLLFLITGLAHFPQFQL
jgi:hypothetical protein